MSIVHLQTVPCTCGVPVEVTTVDSINPVRNPHHKRALLDRTLHLFTCGACGRGLVIEKPLVYLDFERRQFFGTVPQAERAREEVHAAEIKRAFETWLGDQAPAFVREYGKGFLYRLCFGYEELREKVVIDDAGLADLVIEALKLDLFNTIPWFAEVGVATLRLDAVMDDGSLRLVPEGWDGRLLANWGIPLVNRAVYDEVDAKFDEILKVHPGLAKGPHVSLLRLVR